MYNLVTEVKSKALWNFKVDPVLKIDATFSNLDLSGKRKTILLIVFKNRFGKYLKSE